MHIQRITIITGALRQAEQHRLVEPQPSQYTSSINFQHYCFLLFATIGNPMNTFGAAKTDLHFAARHFHREIKNAAANRVTEGLRGATRALFCNQRKPSSWTYSRR